MTRNVPIGIDGPDAAAAERIERRARAARRVSIDVQDYSWGRLVVIRRGIDFSIPLHPEHQAELVALVAGETRVLRVEDGSSWTARIAGDGGLALRCRERRVHLDPDQAATVAGGSW